MGALNPEWLEWGVAATHLPGQMTSGDLYVVAPFPGGVLAAVIDGLGHGSDAARAAETAAAILTEHAQESAISLVQRCHQHMQGTRGAAVSLASFNAFDSTMTWLAVGNVEGILMRSGPSGWKKEGVLLRGGVVGFQLPPLRASVVPVGSGDTLILATDGIRGGFADTLPLAAPPQRIADDIITLFNRGTDDALVLVARWLGGVP